jgi:hypothetical protein
MVHITGCKLILSLKALHIHCRKRFAIFPSPSGMSLSKLSLAGIILSKSKEGVLAKSKTGFKEVLW